MTHLQWRISDIPTVSREKYNGKTLPFRCSRDYIFYALRFYGAGNIAHPAEIETMFAGNKIPYWLVWTMFHMKRLPVILREHNLQLLINGVSIQSWWVLLITLATPRRVSWKTVDNAVIDAVKSNQALGIDFSITPGSLVDHVLFVYGYDKHNYYVLDTLQLPQLPYERVDNNLFLMKLPKAAVKERLGRFSRLWQVVPREIEARK